MHIWIIILIVLCLKENHSLFYFYYTFIIFFIHYLFDIIFISLIFNLQYFIF
jgi:hypothetical protein